jgi:hypothetical protein
MKCTVTPNGGLRTSSPTRLFIKVEVLMPQNKKGEDYEM